MKKIFTLCTIITVAAVLLMSCNKNPAAETKGVSYEDTVGLTQFQNWKMQNERLNADQYYQYASQQSTPVRTAKKSSPNYGSGSMNSGSNNYAKTATPAKKKGWSKAAKGAVIGGAGGAVAGAVINKKNRVAGGVIGGVAGAAIGYVIGRGQDKKDGR
ncbi:MAG: YMGG-like glycine zipper-containing protein [Chitinophagaceae bacterium]